MHRCLIVAVILYFGSAVASAQEAGTWQGTVDQPGSGSYGVTMILDGGGGGSTSYPSLSCGGSLSGGPGTYFESITSNRAVSGQRGGCIDGNIQVQVTGNSMSWYWYGSWQGKSYTASATLHRAGGNGGAPSVGCNTCGRALSSDVSFGVGSSANLRNYVQQSLGKYANCTRREANQCSGDCWRTNLANLLPNCEQFNKAGLLACVNQTVNGANSTCQ